MDRKVVNLTYRNARRGVTQSLLGSERSKSEFVGFEQRDVLNADPLPLKQD
jgi:hypothetical protein